MNVKHNPKYFKVAPGVWGMKILFVNIYMIVSDDHWVLVDTGLVGSAARIKKMAADLFGDMPPAAILLTHGHFDHRGSVLELLKHWQVPVFAHQLEFPYLNGTSAYPPPDPTVGGGLMSLASFLYPKQPINLGSSLQPLPDDGSIPYLPEWQAIFCPGHSPGQVALFRDTDRVLIAADVFVTTRQESAIATLSGLSILSGPPRYFTYDWQAAKASVIKLQQLQPRKAATGHGPVLQGEALKTELDNLVANFGNAMPKHGRYVPIPARVDETGVKYVPSVKSKSMVAITIGAIVAIGVIKILSSKKSKQI